jgi:uncharacterized protein YidB (DUF937 family)
VVVSDLDKMLGGLLGGKGGGDLGSLIGGLTGGGSGGGGNALMAGVVPMLGGMLGGGGLQKVMSGLQSNGLGSQADSWVGKGQNAPVSGDQIRRVMGDKRVGEIAQKLGVSQKEAADAVAKVLPKLVDHASPDGKLAPQKDLDAAFERLHKGSAPKG